MAIYIYPENYEEKNKIDNVIVKIDDSQRDFLKTKLKNFINKIGKPVHLKVLLDKAEQLLIANYNLHIQDSFLKEIVLEIREEFGYPGKEEVKVK